MRGNSETEVKVWVAELSPIEAQLMASGAELTAPRVYERNVRYEDAANSLTPAGRVLRLRQDTRARLTYKDPPQSVEAGVQTRPELEVEVSDFSTADLILRQLGFLPAWVYEKYRTTYHLGGCEVVLDELPFGHFVEVEGEMDAILDVLNRLGLAQSRRIAASYSELFFRTRELLGLTFNELTFDNFAGIDIPRDVLEQF